MEYLEFMEFVLSGLRKMITEGAWLFFTDRIFRDFNLERPVGIPRSLVYSEDGKPAFPLPCLVRPDPGKIQIWSLHSPGWSAMIPTSENTYRMAYGSSDRTRLSFDVGSPRLVSSSDEVAALYGRVLRGESGTGFSSPDNVGKILDCLKIECALLGLP